VESVLQIDIRHRLRRLTLDVRAAVERETLALVGPSGAGKTSVLRAVAGLLAPDEGRIVLGDTVLLDTERGVNLSPDVRHVGLVFQDGALFPHMTVAGNVAYGVRRGDRRRRDADRHVTELLERFAIAHLARVHPPQLSGGERQRVALARAVAADPDVLLLDEPLSALDTLTKGGVAGELARQLASLDLPTILVSHDFEDVVGLASRVAVIEAGQIVQQGSPAELLQAPTSPFVAALAGVNYFTGTGRRRGHLTEVALGREGGRILSTDTAEGPVAVVVYPWEVSVARTQPEGSALNTLPGPIERLTAVGNRVRVTVGSDPPIVAEVTEDSARYLSLGPGLAVVANWKATGTRLIARTETPP
jgi:molybdate transport system ATP-binding protein